MTYCTVSECSHSESHNILSHRCEKCKDYGHGLDFHNGMSQKTIIPIPSSHHCKIEGCQHPKTHLTMGHQCRICDSYGHGFNECENIFSSPSNFIKLDVKSDNAIYVIAYSGMGSYLFFRKSNENMKFETFSMNEGDWGQYGHSQVPQLKKFLEGHKPYRPCDEVIFSSATA